MIPQPPPGQGPIDPRAAFTSAPQGAPQPQTGPGVFSPPIMQPPMTQHQMSPPPGYPQIGPPPMYGPGMMPPQYGPPRIPPRRGRGGRAIAMTILVIALFLSLLVNFISLFGGGSSGGLTVVQQTIQPGNGDEKVVVVPLDGPIGEVTAQRFAHFLDAAEKDQSVKALVIAIDTPGGTVTASDEIYDRIQRFKTSKKVPVIVTMGGMATSGGYYAACGADYIFAQHTTLTGNIGVIWPRYNLSSLMEKYGVQDTTIVSSGATFKNAGSSTSPETPEGTAYLQNLMDSAFKRFKTVVATGRGSKLTGKIDDIANGKAYTADEALQLGLIDQKGYAEDAYKYALQTPGLSKARIVKYSTPPTSLVDLLMSSNSNLSGISAKTSSGININIDANLLNDLTTPRPLYLWRGQ